MTALRTWEKYKAAEAAANVRDGTPTLGYPETTLTTRTCAGGANLPHHERCPMRKETR